MISRALVTSNGNTYVVKISRAMALRFPAPKPAAGEVAGPGPMTACPMVRLSSTSRPIAARPAHSRWPLMVSTSESLARMPTIISTNRNSISTAPVYTMTWTKARNGAPAMA